MLARDELFVAQHIRKIPPAVRPTVPAARRTVKAIAPRASSASSGCAPPPMQHDPQ